MGSLFVNPLLLWGIAGVAAPILIYLLSRYRYRTVEFAAIEFLLRAVKKEQRRLRLENLLLLLIRCLIIVVIALALARPRAPSAIEVDEEDVRHNVVLVIDRSYSTGYQTGTTREETALAAELRAAKEIINGLEEGDRLLVMAFDDTVTNLYAIPKNMSEQGRREAINDLDASDLELSARGTDLAAALNALPRALARFEPDGRLEPGRDPLRKTVFLLTDSQRRGMFDDRSGDPVLIDQRLKTTAQEIQELGGALVLVDCGAENPVNVAISELRTLQQIVGVDLPADFELTLENRSPDDVDDLTISYYVDDAIDRDEPQKTVSVLVPAGESRSPERLRRVFKEPGLHRIAVNVRSDALELDNWRYLVVDVRESVDVLLVEGEPDNRTFESETDFLNMVLSLSPFDDKLGLIRPEVVEPIALIDRPLGDYDVVMLANVGDLDDEMAARLESYAEDGGAVVFSLGAQVKPEDYNRLLWRDGAGLLPCELLEVRPTEGDPARYWSNSDAPAWRMTVGDTGNLVAELFSSEELGPFLGEPTIYGFFAARLPGEGLEEAVVERPSRTPLRLVPRPIDDGSVGGLESPEPLGEAGLPLLVERSFGRGRALIWLSTADDDWNNAVVWDGFYVPFWREIVQDLAKRSGPRHNLSVGGEYRRLLSREDFALATRVEIETPDGRQELLDPALIEREQVYEVVYPAEQDEDAQGKTDPPGIYAIRRSSPTGGAGADEPAPDYFSVNLDVFESDLTKFGADELDTALGELDVKGINLTQVRQVLQDDSGALGAQEYWRHALVALIALLALESLLAAVFGRRRRSPAPAAQA